MSNTTKCSSSFKSKVAGAGGTNEEDIQHADKAISKVLAKNCEAMHESAKCFAQEAFEYNKLLDELKALGSQPLGSPGTPTDQTLNEFLTSGEYSSASELELNAIANGTAMVENEFDKNKSSKNRGLRDDLAKMKGLDGIAPIKGYHGKEHSPDITMEQVSDPGYPNNLPTLADASERFTRGFNTPSGGGQTGYQQDPDNPIKSSKGSTQDNNAANLQELRKHLRAKAGSLPADVDKSLFQQADSLIAKILNKQKEGSRLSQCSKDLDRLANIDLDNATADVQGYLAAHGEGTGAERAAAFEAVAAFAEAPGLSAVPVIQYREQCILLSQITTLAAYSKSLDNKLAADDDATKDTVTVRRRLPYKGTSGGFVGNAPLLIEGQSFGLINRLTQNATFGSFFDATTAELSSLQPLIRLYRIKNANSKKPVTEYEIPFDSYPNKTDISSLLQKKDKRGFGIGIKSFNLNFEGQDMFAQKRSITATLSIFAADFEELMRARTVDCMMADGTKAPQTFRYIDLALKTGKGVKNKDYKENDDLNFRLKAVFGWSKQNATSPIKGLTKKALDDSFVSVNLTPVTHTFDFDDQGRVTFVIEYLAYVEEYYSKPRMNIFTEVSTNVKRLARKLAFDHADRNINCGGLVDKELQEKVKNIKTDDVKTVEKDKQTMHSYLFKQLFNNGYIHFLNFTREDLKGVLEAGPFHQLVGKVQNGSRAMKTTLSQDLLDDFSSQLEGGKADGEKMKLGAALTLSGMDSVQIPFFYVADLLNVIMGDMEAFLKNTADELDRTVYQYKALNVDLDMKKKEVTTLRKAVEEYKKFRLVLGPLEIEDYVSGQKMHINLGDVPVSVKYFSEWLTSKLLKKEQTVYPLTQFLKDLMNDLIRNYLNDDSCYPFSIKQKTRLYENVVTSYPTTKNDEITQAIINSRNKYNRLTVNKMPIAKSLLNIKGNSSYDSPNPGTEKEINYFIFHAGRTKPEDYMTGNKSFDESMGIMHYVLGKDRGIVKNISLRKTDQPGLKEVRFEQDGYDGLGQLMEIYDVNVKTYANVTAFPGNYIYVEPRGFAPSMEGMNEGFDLTDIGIGGYYMIIKASHEFSAGFGETNLTAVHVASKDPDKDPEKGVEKGSGSNKKVSKKCASSRPAMGRNAAGQTDSDPNASSHPSPSDKPE